MPPRKPPTEPPAKKPRAQPAAKRKETVRTPRKTALARRTKKTLSENEAQTPVPQIADYAAPAPAEQQAAFATSPLGVLLGVAQDETMPIALRVQAAKAALPFVHRRRALEKPEPAADEIALHERELDRLLAIPDAAPDDEAPVDESQHEAAPESADAETDPPDEEPDSEEDSPEAPLDDAPETADSAP